MRTRIHEFCKKESFRSSWSFLFTTGKKSQDESFAYPHLARFVDNLDAASKSYDLVLYPAYSYTYEYHLNYSNTKLQLNLLIK